MLFHNLYAPSGGEYFMQMVYTMRGALDATALRHAWQQVVNRHPILRTAFVWEGLDEPLQIVRQQAALEWAQEDVRGLSRVEQEEMLEAYLKADRQKGFELSQAPLMRCALIGRAEDEHTLIWSYHHLLLDGWCLSLIIREVSFLYDAICRGREAGLPPTRPYRDYIAWLQRRDMAQTESFWRRALEGYTAPARLPFEQSGAGPGAQAADRGRDLTLSASTTEALQSLARQHQTTMYNLVQGAWALLLSRYSGEDDVVFGVTVSGRPPEIVGVESMIGLFINTLPVRVKVTPETPLAHWLKTLHAQQTELLEYQHSPLMQVQRWSEVAPPQPLFESILVFENYAPKETSGQVFGGMEITDSYSLERTSYPLTVYVSPGPRLSFRIRHDPRRFGDAVIDRFLAHLGSLLESMAANPEGRLSDASMLTAAEERKVLVEWNDSHADYDAAKTFVRLFEEQVERTPDATAVIFEQERLTYRTLNRRANRLAHHLRAEGVGPEVLVGICVERSIEMLVGLLGIAKAGGAYVPLDPSYPSSRLAFMLEDAGVRLLLTQERHVGRLAEARHGARVLCLDADWETISRQGESDLPGGATTSNLAYVIYTSGSTGRPKGVQVSHLALANLLHAMRSGPGLEARDKILSVTTPSFDIAAVELYLPLTVGGCVQIVSREAAVDAGLLAREVSNSGATVMQATPAMWRLLIDSGWKGDGRLKMLCGGEALTAELAARLLERGGSLWNLYGPTETTIYSTARHVEPAENPVSLGRPIANTEIYILDNSLRPVAVGVPGNLYLGGDGLARGYLRRPALTAEKFIPHPFTRRAGARLYGTGDTARYMADGRIEYLGRSDQQVKVRGFRIELGEVEAAVLEHGGVRECMTVVREDEPDDKRLVAYVVPYQRRPAESPAGNGHQETAPTGLAIDETAQPLSARELGHFLRAKLPAYMIPSAFVELDALPLTPNGKIDRRALPAPGLTRFEMEREYVAPRTPLEETLAKIFADTLRLERVGIYDNFFELGGHSLLATQVVSRVRASLRAELTLRDLFDKPTVEKLSGAIEQAMVAALQSRLAANTRVTRPA